MKNKKKKLISIVTPCFNEDGNIELCYKELKKIFKSNLANYDYEHIFCDNASTDNSINVLRKIAAKDKNIKVIVHSRNFGAFNSFYNGMLAAKGDGIIPFFPADMQDPPEVIPKLVEKWEKGFEVVFGKKITRDESRIMQGLRKVYYKLVSKVANIEIPQNVGEFSLIDKKVQDALRGFEDYYPYLRGMIASCGFKTSTVEYAWKKRLVGKTSGGALILIDNAINGLISFTNLPMRLCMFFGFGISFMALIYSSYSFFMAFTGAGGALPGIPLLITAVFFFFGVTLFFLGVLGEYVSAIHFQVRKRPLVIEAERINFEK